MLIASFRRLIYIIGCAVLLAGLTSSVTYAYSGTGLGTSSNPYKIATCQQLQDIKDDLSAHYQLTGNIDCSATTGWNSGAGFTPIGTFTGVLDGQNFTVNGLYENTGSNASAIFSTTDGATIKNIHLRGGSFNNTNNSYNGSFAISASDTVFSNCSSTISILSNAGAGLVGYMGSGSMTNCWYDGTVTSASAYGAGLVSVAGGSATFTNVYSKGTITESGPYGAGLIANIDGTSSVTNAYSTATVNAGVSYSGGLFAVVSSGVSISNVFYAGALNKNGTTSGPFVGTGSGYTLSAAYYDVTLCGCGTAGNGGNLVNSGNSTPNYFKNNSSNAPLDNWNFSTVWRTNSTDYPTLRIPAAPSDGDDDKSSDAVEAAAPNGGDANNDGVADSAQTNVTSVVSGITGNYATLSSTCDSNTDVSVNSESTNSATDHSFSYPLGLMNFTLHCNTSGQTATVTQYFYTSTDPSGLVVRKYNSVTNTYQAITDATIKQVAVGGKSAIKITYQITDGGTLDQDGIANGTIVDPTGLAQAAISVPNTGLGGTYLSKHEALLATK